MSTSSRFLLTGAVAATPLFLVFWAVQAFSRDGFRPTYHPMSLLSLGDWGWVQVIAFVLVGLLLIGGGIGLSRALGEGRLSRWIGSLVVLMGVGLVVSGVFATDAGAGFPEGAPAGAPEMSWHGAVHEVGFLLTQIAFIAAGILLAVSFARDRRRGWAAGCIIAVMLAVLVAGLGDPENLAIRLVLSSSIELGLVSVVAANALRERGPASDRASAARLDYAEPHGSTSRT
ncbi:MULTISPECIES: DUF998 domain-containing protein [unclassified Leifsonia]|uniref:DUF998 domain-containing protein n=1 Tax=unclassified Leifsonia TaxID=2663824 RepID=UPI0006F45B13|nr:MULTISPECIES: DUF998 domain-containing protein [unclassified Leifsonia]KQX07651.1 hypothetical protein ASC59_07940 [Leifsonia sp. Root1293]KRA11933.1 hypothetical protein ASD61_07940 [Leifsonia sp. Root60]